MKTSFSYRCMDYPGMECPGHFFALTETEVWQHLELHARIAHEEDPDAWSAEEVEFIKGLVRSHTA